MKIAIIRFKQQNPLGHYSEDQGSTEAKFKITKVRLWETTSTQDSLLQSIEKFAMCNLISQITLIPSVSEHALRHRLVSNEIL